MIFCYSIIRYEIMERPSPYSLSAIFIKVLCKLGHTALYYSPLEYYHNDGATVAAAIAELFTTMNALLITELLNCRCFVKPYNCLKTCNSLKPHNIRLSLQAASAGKVITYPETPRY